MGELATACSCCTSDQGVFESAQEVLQRKLKSLGYYARRDAAEAEAAARRRAVLGKGPTKEEVEALHALAQARADADFEATSSALRDWATDTIPERKDPC